MTKNLRTRGLGLRNAVALAATLLIAGGAQAAGTWQTTLKKRDFNGDGVVDAYYDTALNVTWLYNFDLVAWPGFKTWSQARTWASGLNVAGVTGWRLPKIDGAACDWYWTPQQCALGPQGKKSELLYMMYRTLGGMHEKGPFLNFLPLGDGHWYDNELAGDPTRAWGTFWYAGNANDYDKALTLFPWPVKQGDVGTPLP